MSSENSHWLARLNEQRLVRFELAEAFQDRIEAFPVPGGLSSPPVYDQVIGVERYLGIQIVLDHSVCRLDQPILTGDLFASWSFDWSLHSVMKTSYREITVAKKRANIFDAFIV